MIVKGTKEDSLNYRRLRKIGESNNAHHKSLCGVYVDGPYTWATDGFVAAAIPTPEGLAKADGKIIDPNIIAGEFMAEANEIDGSYPDVYGIRPMSPVAAEVVVNAKSLRRIAELAGDQPVRIVIHDGPPKSQPLEIRSTEADPEMNVGNTPVYALIMPMHVQHEREYVAERPERTDEDNEQEVRQSA